MTVIQVRVTTVFEVNTTKYVAAGIAEGHLAAIDWVDTDHQEIANDATAYADPTDGLPRWARESVQVVSHKLLICGELVEP